jgi:hypothetical protein
MDEERLENHKILLILILVSLSCSLIALAITFVGLFTAG